MPVDSKRLPIPEESKNPCVYAPKDVDQVLFTRNGDRVNDQVRPIFVKAGAISQAKGSAYAEAGNTKVICAVYGPREVTRRDELSMKGQLSCEFKYATFSRQQRQQHQQNNDEKDLSLLLQEALEPAVMLEKFPKARMDVFITVLEDDGSCLALSLTVASLALVDAGIHMYDVVIGSSIKMSGDVRLADPTANEERTQQPSEADLESGCLTVGFMPSLHQVATCWHCGRLSTDALKRATSDCIENCIKLYPVVQDCLVASIAEHTDS